MKGRTKGAPRGSRPGMGAGAREQEAHLGENPFGGRGALGELRFQGPGMCSTVPIGLHLQNII